MAFIQTDSLQVFKIKEFRLFILVRLFLTLAIQMQFSTIYLQIYYEYSKDELILGLIGLAEAIPFIATSFFSGHYVDLFSKKKIILLSTMLLMLGAVFLFLNAQATIHLLHSAGIGVLFSIVFLFGIIRAFLGATTNPYLSQLVPRKDYTHSATWNSTAWHTGAILGPVLAGLIYGHNNSYNAQWCHFIEIVLFLISLILIIRINNPGAAEHREKRESVFESMKVGLNFVFKTKMVLSAISLDLFAVLFGGAVVLIPAFTDKILHLGPEAYGLLRTAPAIGAVVSAFIMAAYPPAKKAGIALIWSVIAFGIFTILFGLSKSYWMACAMLFFTGAFDNVSVVVRHSILQLMTPNNMRGRVSAINNIFVGSSNEIGAFESGVTAKFMGLIPSIIFGGGMTILVVLGIHKINPKLKELDINELS
ncbi:MFS transporter [Aurantibacillus circumpalustris]|uniref:MFS transporter n=1 Tax=Aurantibacillus circumpalustris TaxID=3036359 RepID=UPI00295B984D|nr:MFS transporter [Aurantibacillus circumpalustris]